MLAALRRETFPLLMDPVSYSPDTLDIWSNRPEMDYWLSILGEQVDNIVEKALASEGNSPGACLRPEPWPEVAAHLLHGPS